MVNRAAPLIAAGAAALDHHPDTRVLTELLHQLPRPTHRPEPVTAAGAAAPQKDTLVAARHQALKEDVERFYLSVVDRDGEELSALEYLQEGELEWGEEIWLFQVIAEFQGLPRSEQHAFSLRQQESQASPFNHLRLIHDVSLALRAGA